jgi:hypothetical protein
VVLLQEAVARLSDLTASTDSNQQGRDADAIATLNDAIGNEDCVGLSKANQNVVDIIVAASLDVAASRDYAEGARAKGPIEDAPLIVVGDASFEKGELPACRCYARQQALQTIFEDARSLNITWSERTTKLETYAVKGLWAYLALVFQPTMDGMQLGTPGNDVALETKIRIASAQLSKHCGLSLWGKAPQIPSACKYHSEYEPSPTPT